MLKFFKNKWVKGPKLRSLRRCQGGTAAIEMAFILPLFIGLTTGGIEVTWYANTKMKVSQLALHAADHSSRMGTSTVLQNLPVFEADVNDVMTGTLMQGESIQLKEHGRVIISSLQRNPTGGQWIAWQRCDGNPAYDSTHGLQGAGATYNSFPGMGFAASRVQARADEAVMFAEIRYQYEPIFDVFDMSSDDYIMSEVAAFNVRDDRDLSQIYSSPAEQQKTC
jgi:TadE-like protein